MLQKHSAVSLLLLLPRFLSDFHKKKQQIAKNRGTGCRCYVWLEATLATGLLDQGPPVDT